MVSCNFLVPQNRFFYFFFFVFTVIPLYYLNNYILYYLDLLRVTVLPCVLRLGFASIAHLSMVIVLILFNKV